MNELQRLEMLDTILWLHSRDVLTAIASKGFLNWQFYGLPEEERARTFKTNVANNILYRNNEAMITAGTVSISEHLQDILKQRKRTGLLALPFPEEDVEELRKHRHVLSHSANVAFRDPAVQKFYEEGRHWKDFSAKRIWRVREALLKYLTALGSNRDVSLPNDVVVQLGTCQFIQSALAISYLDGVAPPPMSEVAPLVYQYFEKFNEALKVP
ncbi:hypothetical protein [Bdellovibrio sp. KM01]|uniref:hypothetical protein n=1 Tax=Bdellovibrio sp. KM01 TaxID=2748865 RepID=UPI0015EA66FE|nr:hypothetical protein [Bdellovibrio sp. KM01]QLY24898.1 hypothetical protein HW988_15920 [Bdellovibrio sp. KM01]